jgi:hypothetical protein
MRRSATGSISAINAAGRDIVTVTDRLDMLS